MQPNNLDGDLFPLYSEIMNATSASDIFDNIPGGMSQRDYFRQLRHAVNPARFTNPSDSAAAEDARAELERLYREARGIGTTPYPTFTIGTSRYTPRRVLTENSDVRTFLVETEEKSLESTRMMVLKVPRTEAGAARLGLELENLRRFASASSLDPLYRLRNTLPLPPTTIEIDGVTALMRPYYHEHMSVADIIERFQYHLPLPHAAWIGRRVLALPRTGEMARLEHSSVHAGHILVHPVSHEPVYLGWGHATPAGQAPRDESIRAATAAVASLLSDGAGHFHPEVPNEFREFVETTLTAKNLPSSVEVLDTFTDIVRRHLGRQYHPLTIPN